MHTPAHVANHPPFRGHTDTPQFKKVVKKVVDSGARVIYMGTKPEPDTTSIHSDYEKYDAKIRALAAEYAVGTLAPTPSPTVSSGSGTPSAAPAPLTMVDVYPSFNALGNPSSLYGDDNLHMSSEGYSYWERWATLALETPSCVIWESGNCTFNATDTYDIGDDDNDVDGLGILAIVGISIGAAVCVVASCILGYTMVVNSSSRKPKKAWSDDANPAEGGPPQGDAKGNAVV